MQMSALTVWLVAFYFPIQIPSLFSRECIQRKIWCLWPYTGIDYNSTPLSATKGKGWSGKISPIGWVHLCLSTNFQYSQKEKGKYGEGVRAELMSLNRHNFLSGECIQRKIWCSWPYAGVDYNSTPLSAIHPHYKGKGVEWGRSLLLVEHICVSLLISKTANRKKESTEKGWELNLCLWIDMLWSMGNLMPELTLTPHRS